MNFGDIARKRLHTLFLASLMAVVATPQVSLAQEAVAPAATTESTAAAPVAAVAAPISAEAPAATPADAGAVAADSSYTPLKAPEWIRGAPTPGAIDFQTQHTDDGRFAYGMHTFVLMPIITAISLFVLALLLWVVVRYNRKRNAVPSKTSHNTLIEVIWTVVPVLILVVIAVPSITLLARQYDSAPKDALTIKATGYQWYWGYSYPDNGGFEVISNMLSEEDAIKNGEPPHLAADNRMVVPVGETIRIQVVGADVIHSFGVPSLWFKIDAVPGRINERTLKINEPGIYYGQCMELCGARHGYMPIAIEALPRPQFEAWVRSQGGTVPGDAPAAAPATAPAAAPAPAAAAPAADASPAATAPAA
ncbi:cytochrome c oxidase subunit II [Altererythrobacter sp. Root672]|uniref:cytochrome c oxidase subunit II n=1 Tax=Altererythrobacter sp. Root672 TaxID=1736584 RepID=UPI0006FC2FD6|nr:cytochrome c oxidase subunit II [Altererythrobacter sp. Root672]KRA82800.1 cytochrome C oxidase subunit II [Altererythrobacter sp. Root672]